MKTHLERQIHFSLFSTPTPDSEEYEAFVRAADSNLANNPKLKKEVKKKREKALRIARTQSLNGIGLPIGQELRYFHAEFNHRTWKFGFGARPSAFNVIEAFFKWNPNLFYFELIEEVEHLFSFFDFIDFVTSSKCSHSFDHFKKNTEEELIYSYNILNSVKDISFRTNDSKEYFIGGVSFVKRGDEVSMLILAGEKADVNEISKNLPDLESAEGRRPYIKAAKDRKKEAVKFLDQADLWKVNIYIRIDLRDNKIDCRYIQKDIGQGFTTLTDDIGIFKSKIEGEKDFDEFIKNHLQEVNNYEPIFEVAYNCLYLPEYFDRYDANVLAEEHPTGLINESKSRSPLKNHSLFDPDYFTKSADVWVLDQNVNHLSKDTILKKTELVIEKDGYWEYLEPGKIGVDKNGNPIHNRTWVEKTLAWRESSKISEVKVQTPKTTTPNSGFIYVLRNPAHELNIYKIGLTTKTVEERANQLSGTPSPDKFLIACRWQVSDCVLAEKLIHEKLDKYRVNTKREFFKIELEKAIDDILPIIKLVNEGAPHNTVFMPAAGVCSYEV